MKLVRETDARCRIATMVNTEDKVAEARLNAFYAELQPTWLATDQKLKQMLLTSGLQPLGMETPLQKMRVEAALFCAADLPLVSEERKLQNEYNRLIGAQMVAWQGQALTIDQLKAVYQAVDRNVREQAWRLASTRQLADRQPLNALWQQLLTVRQQMAVNAGHENYRSFRWQQLVRLDYTPADCLTFHAAIAEVVVPAAERVYDRRRRQLGVETLRPWDLDVIPMVAPPCVPLRMWLSWHGRVRRSSNRSTQNWAPISR